MQTFLKVNQTLPTVTGSENSQMECRGGKYGELAVVPYGHGIISCADEGQYFKCTSQTPGTAVTYVTDAAYAATSASICIYNGSTTKRVYIDYIRILCTTAPGSATAARWAIAIDGVNRVASGGSTLTPVNVNMASSTTSGVTFTYGAPTLAAASAARILGTGVLRGAIPVVNDEYILSFGTQDNGSIIVSGTSTIRSLTNVGPVIIGPGNSMLLHQWFTGNTGVAFQFEVECGFYER